jgi:hypothetical protein
VLLKLAVIFGVVVDITAVVFTGNVAVVACAGTVILAGTLAAALSLESITIAPPTTAGLLNVTVPVVELPPVTVLGDNDTVEIPGMMEVTCTVPVVCVPLYVPVIFTKVEVFTALVVTVKVPVVCPAGTVTLPGTVATTGRAALVINMSPMAKS